MCFLFTTVIETVQNNFSYAIKKIKVYKIFVLLFKFGNSTIKS